MSDHPGELPEVHDEAADSPWWLPILGFVLLALVGMLGAAHSKRNAEKTPEGNAAEVTPAEHNPS